MLGKHSNRLIVAIDMGVGGYLRTTETCSVHLASAAAQSHVVREAYILLMFLFFSKT